MDEFTAERLMLPYFRRGHIIPVGDQLIDAAGFNLKEVPSRSYKIFTPLLQEEQNELERVLDPVWLIYNHMLAVRSEAFDVIGEEYLFIRAYRVGHTLELEPIVVVVEAQVKGGCHVFDDDGRIAGDGTGRWYGVLYPAEAESELVADLRAEEAERRKALPKMVFERRDPEYDSWQDTEE